MIVSLACNDDLGDPPETVTPWRRRRRAQRPGGD